MVLGQRDWRRVHLTGVNPPSFGVARVGPVYTPPVQRGRGWASNAVAEVSRQIQAEGARVCLFTDQANPISNKIYAALGYRPVVDMANLVIVR
jgi:predicted GNAT family acetyltransferase